jgi:heptaprenyl diphosphate synthase
MISRDRRIDLSYRFFTSKDLFISGLLCILALFLSPNLYFRAFLFVYFYFFTWIQGKRNSLVITLFITVSIVFFNLLVPYGKVLFRLWTFPVTQGALLTGLEKAITLEALIMLSRASIRSDLQLPGTFGSLIAESFRIFEELIANKKQFDWKKPIESIDTILLKLSEKTFLIEDQKTIGGTLRERAAGSLLLILQTALIWTIFFAIKY